MKIKARSFLIVLLVTLGVIANGCGSGGGGGGGAGGSGSGGSSSNSGSRNGNQDIATNPASAYVEKYSGDNQAVPIGTSLSAPLVARVIDGNGNPAAGVAVKLLLISGKVTSFTSQATTDSGGLAKFQVQLGAGLEKVLLNAVVSNMSPVTFQVTPRLPFLGELVAATIGDAPVSDLPVVAGTINNYGKVLVLLTGDAPRGVDLGGLPTAVSLLGAFVDAVLADDMPVLFIPAAKLVDTIDYTEPKLGGLSGKVIVGQAAEDLSVTMDFSVNAHRTMVALNGDVTGISGAINIGDLLDANPAVDVMGVPTPASDMPTRLLDTVDYPAPAEGNNYIAIWDDLVPVFNSAKVIGLPDTTVIPALEKPFSISNTESAELVGGDVPMALTLSNITPLVDVCLPAGPIDPFPDQYSPVVQVIQDEILPLSDGVRNIIEAQRTLLQQLGAVIDANAALIAGWISGQITDPLALAGFATQVLPIVNDLIENQLLLFDVQEQQLALIRSDLLPAIDAALPPDGMPFGGFSDGNQSTVADDVLPLIDAELALLQEAMPQIKQLLTDLAAFIPDDGSLVQLLLNISNGGLTNVLTDLEALRPLMIEGLVLFNDQGIPILYDLLEQAEHDIPPGTMTVSDLDGFVRVVEWLSARMPADVTLGELPGFEIWGPMIANRLPPEWGNAADVSLFDTLLPAIGNLDIGGDILPVLRTALDALAAGLPNVINWLENFSFLGITFP